MRSIEPVVESSESKRREKIGELKAITSRKKRYPFQFSVILLGSVIILGILLLIYFFGNSTFLVFVGILLIPVYMGVYWVFRVLRKDRKYTNISMMAEIERSKTISNKEAILVNEIKPLLEEKGAINIQITSTNPPKITCNFAAGNTFDFFEVVNFHDISSKEFKMESVIKGNYPFSLSIRRKTSTKKLVLENLELFSFHSNSNKLLTSIQENKKINKMLLDVGKNLVSFSLNGKFLSASFISNTAVHHILELSNHIYNDVQLQDYGEMDVEHILCYQCDEPFEPTEMKCKSCGASRPTCTVCLLDLKPSERKEVVRTPCCETYAHKGHIISWLEENPKCPTCRSDLFLWIRQLKIE